MKANDNKAGTVTNAAGEFASQLRTIGLVLDAGMIKALNQAPFFHECSGYYMEALQAFKKGECKQEQGEGLGHLLISLTGLSVPAIQLAHMLSETGIPLAMRELQQMNASPRFQEYSGYYLESLAAYKKGAASEEQVANLSSLLHEVWPVNPLTIDFAKRVLPIGIVMDRAELGELDHEQKGTQLSHATIYFSKKLLEVGIKMDRQVLVDLDKSNSIFRENEGHYLACTKAFDRQKKIINDSYAAAQIANLLYSLHGENKYSDKVLAIVDTPPYVAPVEPPKPASFVARVRPKAATLSVAPAPFPKAAPSWTEQILSYMPDRVQSWASYVGLQTSPSPSTSPPVQKVAAGR